MTTKKITITLPDDTLRQLNAAAKAEGAPVSRFIADTMAAELRRRAGLAWLDEWQTENGPLTTEELTAAQTIIAQVDTEMAHRATQQTEDPIALCVPVEHPGSALDDKAAA